MKWKEVEMAESVLLRNVLARATALGLSNEDIAGIIDIVNDRNLTTPGEIYEVVMSYLRWSARSPTPIRIPGLVRAFSEFEDPFFENDPTSSSATRERQPEELSECDEARGRPPSRAAFLELDPRSSD